MGNESVITAILWAVGCLALLAQAALLVVVCRVTRSPVTVNVVAGSAADVVQAGSVGDGPP
ncbi:hypothetical protein [Saccharothrix xinjiangensis]|uniref:Uncharacterized protein n=1 Tax=Saccharothrix xinjiangensis TaxID=204798 RepID=A0ABV9YC01_9PSEU